MHEDYNKLTRAIKKVNKRSLLDRLLGRRTGVCGILTETLQGEGGILPATPSFLAACRSLSSSCGALLAFDEVQTGCGRTGALWNHQNYGVVPDCVTSAKALGGGVVPLGACVMTGESAGVFGPGTHASTSAPTRGRASRGLREMDW